MNPQTLLPKGKVCWALAIGAITFLTLTSYLFVQTMRPTASTLRLCVGEELLFRPEIVEAMHIEAAKCGLALTLSPGSRGEDSLQRVANGDCDAAIVFGGLGIDHPDVRQVACLRGEPLHLFVKPEIAPLGLAGIKGKRINVGPKNGETQITVKQVIEHMGIKPGVDFVEEHHSIKDLLDSSDADLPDVIFLSARLPSVTGRTLAQKHGYCLIDVPFGEVLALRSPVVSEIKIPANTYGYNPPTPVEAVRTVGCHTMVIAHRTTPAKAVRRLLEMLCESDFSRRIGKPPLDTATIVRVREFPLHQGAAEYLSRNEPWISQQLASQFGELKEVLLSGFSALLLFWGWVRRRSGTDLGETLRRATAIEFEALQDSRNGVLDAGRLAFHTNNLASLKLDTLEKVRNGSIPDDAAFSHCLSRIDHSIAAVAALPKTRGTLPMKAVG